MSRGRALTREQRLTNGYPVCSGDPTCGRSPSRRGRCRVHRAPLVTASERLGLTEVVAIKVPVEDWARVRSRAAQERITAAAWARRALATALRSPDDPQTALALPTLRGGA